MVDTAQPVTHNEMTAETLLAQARSASLGGWAADELAPELAGSPLAAPGGWFQRPSIAGDHLAIPMKDGHWLNFNANVGLWRLDEKPHFDIALGTRHEC
jgi:hypothetical protein